MNDNCKNNTKKPKKRARKSRIKSTSYEEFDGSITYTGEGGGSVNVPKDPQLWNLITYTKGPRRSSKKCFLDLLWAAKGRLPQDTLTLDDVADYKEECRCILEALRKGKPQFFRDIADMIKKEGKLSEKEADGQASQRLVEDKILGAISVAFSYFGKPPKFKILLVEAQKTTGLGTKLTAQKLKERLECLGFEWLRDN